MPRLRQVARAETTDPLVLQMYQQLFDERDPVAEPGTATGTPGDWWTVFALVPGIFRHAVQGFGVYRSPDRIIDPVLRELGRPAPAGRVAVSSCTRSTASRAARSG